MKKKQIELDSLRSAFEEMKEDVRFITKGKLFSNFRAKLRIIKKWKEYFKDLRDVEHDILDSEG